MKTTILCLVFLIAGAAGGWAVAAYLANRVHQRQIAMFYAGEVSLTAMRAEQIKSGEGGSVLKSLEDGLPDQVLYLRENDMFKETIATDGALHAVKRFYVCTKTEIPERIASALSEIELGVDACSLEN